MLEIDVREDSWFEAYPVGLDTVIETATDDTWGSVRLNWVQAQQLYRWLKERLGE